MIYSSNLDFLLDLKNNNNREWFNSNKGRFELEQANIVAFAEELFDKLKKHDLIETPSGKRSLYRIYRDVRFSKDKTPYQNYWGGGFRRATKHRRGGYYYHIESEKSCVVGGFWGPNAHDLKCIRKELMVDASKLRSIINNNDFLNHFGSLKGEKLKTAPKGFDKNHPDIELLRYKQFLLIKNFTDEEVLSANFVELVDETFKHMRPFFDYMSEILTIDANGVDLF